MVRTLLVFGILVPGVVMALGDRYKALLLYVWFAFFRPDAFLWYDISAFRPSLTLGLLLLVPAIMTGVLPNISQPLSIGTLMFLLSGLLAQLNAVNQDIGWEWIGFFIRLALVCLLAVTLIKTPRELVSVMAVAGGSLGFYGAKAGLASLIQGGAHFADGLAFEFGDNNGYALGLVMSIPLVIAIAQNAQLVLGRFANPRTIFALKVGCYLAAPLSAYTVVSTFSREGFLALVAGASVFSAFYLRRIRFILGAMVVVGMAITVVPLPAGYLQRLSSIQADPEAMDISSRSRLDFWQTAMDMAKDHPLGIGMRNFEATFDAYDSTNGQWGRARSVHSSHFQVLAEQGYFGAAVWMLQFAMAFGYAVAARRRARTPGLSAQHRQFLLTVPAALVASMTGFIVGGSFIALALNSLTWLTFALVAALDRVSKGLVADLLSADRPLQPGAHQIPRPSSDIPRPRRAHAPFAP